MQLSVKHMLLLSLKELQKNTTFVKAVNLWLRMYLYLNVILNVLLNSVEVLAVASVLAGAIHAIVVTVPKVAKTIELKLAPTLMDLLPTLKLVLAVQLIVMHQVVYIVMLLLRQIFEKIVYGVMLSIWMHIFITNDMLFTNETHVQKSYEMDK